MDITIRYKGNNYYFPNVYYYEGKVGTLYCETTTQPEKVPEGADVSTSTGGKKISITTPCEALWLC